jgi:molecular chaperone Hsp33
VDKGEPIEVVCHFCNKRYDFTVGELDKLLQELGNTRA